MKSRLKSSEIKSVNIGNINHPQAVAIAAFATLVGQGLLFVKESEAI